MGHIGTLGQGYLLCRSLGPFREWVPFESPQSCHRPTPEASARPTACRELVRDVGVLGHRVSKESKNYLDLANTIIRAFKQKIMGRKAIVLGIGEVQVEPLEPTCGRLSTTWVLKIIRPLTFRVPGKGSITLTFLNPKP